jgi:hypothetical protein
MWLQNAGPESDMIKFGSRECRKSWSIADFIVSALWSVMAVDLKYRV